jgi:signal transduction histidine kinase
MSIDVNPDAIARLVVQAARVPVYGVIDSNIGSGIVGGMVRGTRATGARVGEMARQILTGRRARDIPIEDAPLVPTFDWRQVRRWGIDPSRLPRGSDVQFRTPTAWETYREYIVGTIVVIVAQLLLIAGLLTQRARRRRAEAMVRASEATLRTSYERIRHLAGRLINAQEAARASIARDLHDDVCQRLASVSIGVSNLKSSSGRIQAPQTQEALSELEHETLDMLEAVRRLSHDLHPASLRLLGLVPALHAHCLEVQKRHDVLVGFSTAAEIGRLNPEVALCLFRIAQECLRNGIEHGGARQFRVSLARTGEHVELTVTDDGRGFDVEAARRAGTGLGLVSIEERARVVGGDVHIASGRQGTTIRVRCPAAAEPAPVRAATESSHVRRA